MLTPAQAEALILGKVPLLESEACPLETATGRVLRADLVADRDFPPYDRVTMDGFALRESDGGLPTLQIVGMQAAGGSPSELNTVGAALEIATGAVLPKGTDTIVPYEDCVRELDTVRFRPGVIIRAGEHLHKQGTDAKAGDVLVRAGRRIGGREAAIAAACGYAKVQVTRKPKVAVVATGDELVEVGNVSPQPHQVRRSNDAALRAALQSTTLGEVSTFHLRDDKDHIKNHVAALLPNFDVILLTGGISKGKFDFLPTVFSELGLEKGFHGVAQRPGKPFWFGMAESVPIFALPGNPVSTFTCFRRYVLPALIKMSGLPPENLRQATLASAYTFTPPLAPLLPAKLMVEPSGKQVAHPAPTHTSGDFAGLIETDGFIELPPGPQTYAAGTAGTFWPWQPDC